MLLLMLLGRYCAITAAGQACKREKNKGKHYEKIPFDSHILPPFSDASIIDYLGNTLISLVSVPSAPSVSVNVIVIV